MKAFKHILLTGICLMWFCLRVSAQLCPSSALAPVFKQDFGQGTTALSTTSAVSGSTNYVFGGVGTDGNYVITPSFDVSGKADWTKLGDHTGNTFGNMFLVNAGGGKSIFFKQTVTGLCSGSTFNFSAWLANANTPNTINVCGSGYVYPNVIFNIKNLGGTVLATFNTGNLPLSPNNGPANWQQYGFQFTLPAGTNSLVLEMVDKWGGAAACGNDLALDDILFTACTPEASISLSTSATVCTGSTTTFSTTLTNSPFTDPAYQWQKSMDNGVTWSNIGTAGTSANSFPIASVTAGDGGQYRVLVGPDVSSLSSNSCITASTPITFTVNSVPAVSVANNPQTVCSGTTLALSAAVTGGTSPFSYSWAGPNSFSSTIAAPSLATVPLAAAGAYSVTVTDAKGCVVVASTTVTVNATPAVAAISGTLGGCVGTTFNVTNATTGGSWSSSNPLVASITSGGVITALSAGSTVISYSVTSNGCAQAATRSISTAKVQLQPDVIACNNIIQFDQNPFTPYYSGGLPGDTYLWNITGTGGTVAYQSGSTTASQYPYVQLSNGAVYSVALRYTTNGVTCSDTQLIYKYIVAADTIQTSHDTTLCNSVSLIALSATASSVTNAFSWTTNGSGTFSNPGALNTNYTPSAADKASGSIKIYFTAFTDIATTGSCPSSTAATDSMILRIVPQNTGTSVPQTICSGTALSFTPSSSVAGSLFTWTSAVTSGSASGNALSGTGNITDRLVDLSATSNAIVTYSITPYVIVPGGNTCAGTAFGFSVTVTPSPVINAISTTVCSGVSFSITPVNGTDGVVPTGTTYTWPAPTGAGLSGGATQVSAAGSITGTLMNTGTVAASATYIVTPVSNGCTGNTFTVTVTVNAANVIAAITSTICSGTTFSITPSNGIVIPGSMYQWSTPVVSGGMTGGAGSAGSANIAGTLFNPTNTSQTAVYTVTPVSGSCTGNTFTVTLSVSPVASLLPVAKTTCSGIAFSFTPADGINGIVSAGTTYTWASPVTTGGVTGGSSTSNATAVYGVLYNTTNTVQTATYTVIPSTGACGAGAGFTITIAIDPILVITPMTVTTCSGTSFTLTPANGSNGIIPSGTVYTWTAPTGSGFSGAVSQTISQGAIDGHLINLLNTATTATYSVTAVSGSCATTSFSVSVTISPVALIMPLTTTTCSGVSFGMSPANGSNGIVPASTLYNWSAPVTTGSLTGGNSATGATVISGTLVNSSSTQQTATYQVTPASGSCTGAVFTVTVTVDPVAAIYPMTLITCSGVSFTITPTDGINGTIPAGTRFSWTVPSVSAGLTGGMSSVNTGVVSGKLVNTSNVPQTATYTVTTIGVCSAITFAVTITINPVAAISALTTTTCSGAGFTITPTDIIHGIVPAGTTYSWSAPVVTGSVTGGNGNTAATNVSGILFNPTNTQQTATYTVTPATIACGPGSSFTVTITIYPKASIVPLSITTCSGIAFGITPNNGAAGIIPAGTLYTWGIPSGAGFTGGVSQTTPTAHIDGSLVNSTSHAVTATYLVTPVSGNCAGDVFSLTVQVDPVATVTAMTLVTCSGVSFSLTPADAVDGIIPAGTTYKWLAPVGSGITGGSSQTTSTSIISGVLINTTSIARTASYFITPVTGCGMGTAFTLVVTVDPKATVSAISTITCSGTAFGVTPTDIVNGIVPAGTVYTWGAPTGTGFTGGVSNSTASPVINGLLTNNTSTAQTATYFVSPVTASCAGAGFTVTVRIDPVAVISSITSVTCSGVLFSVTPTDGIQGIVPAGTTYSWSAPFVTGGITGGNGNTGATNISGVLSNPTHTTQTATYTVTPFVNNCGVGASFTVTVSLNPAANISALSLSTCSGVVFDLTPTQAVNGVVPAGTVYTWNAPTGIGFTGGLTQVATTSHISGQLTNTGNTAHTATYLVAPVSGSCTGLSFSLIVSVEPVAIITAMTTVACSGAAFTITPTQLVNGVVPSATIYSWTAPVVTGAMTGGAGALNSATINGTLNNPTNIAQTATYTVSPVSGTCAGASFTVTVTVTPVAAITNMTLLTCSGVSFTMTPAQGTNGIVPAGTVYSWLAPTGNGITGGVSGTLATTINGLLSNTTSTSKTAVYLVTPLSGNCTANAFTVTITVDPAALITAITNISCSGTAFTITPVDGTNGIVPAGTTYTWSAPTGTGFTGGLSQVTGTTSISGLLTNTTNISQTITYLVTPATPACGAGAAFTVTISLNPAATIYALSVTTCSGITFSLTPTNGTDGIVPANTRFTWVTTPGNGITGGMSNIAPSLNIYGTLTNTTNTAATASYAITPVSGNCPGTLFSVTVNVNPVASITGMSAITCSGSMFAVAPANIVNGIVPAGTTYTWPAPAVTGGITGGASAVAAATISGTLLNATSSQQTAVYSVTPSTASCGSGAAFTVTVTVNAVAAIHSLSVTTCSGVSFSLTPVDGVDGIIPPGTVYAWSAPTGTGFTGGASVSVATAAITGSLINATSTPRTATYTITTSTGNCTGATFVLTVTINPSASLTAMTGVTCSGAPFSITPADNTNGIIPAGTTYSSAAPMLTTGLTGGAGSSSVTAVNGTLINNTQNALTATYIVTPVTTHCGAGAVFTVTITVNPLAKAAITVLKNIDCAPFHINATVLSPVLYNGSNASYDWYINHVYAGSGSFPGYTLPADSVTIQLKTSSLFGCQSDSTEQLFKVYVSPVTTFNLNNNAGCGPLSVTVNNSTPQLSTYQYRWDFGNGQTSTQAQPATILFLPSSSGYDTTYNISLKAFQYCDTVTATKQVTVSRAPKTELIANVINTCSPMKVIFSNNSIGTPSQYRLQYGDGKDSALTTTTIVHTYYTGSNSNLTAILYASNACGTDSSLAPLAIQANPLRVDLSFADSIVCGSPFTASIHNNTTNALQYKWDFGDGTPVTTSQTTGIIPHAYQQPGTYTIKNNITSNCNDTVIYRQLKIYNNIKAIAASAIQGNCIGTPVSFKNLSDSSLSALWSFGDGDSAAVFSGTHAYAQAGDYNVMLKVWLAHNDITCYDSTLQTLTLVDKKPGQLSLSDTAGKCIPFRVSFLNKGLHGVQTKWTWGDGTQNTGDSLTHTFSANGNYTVKMEAVQQGGCTYVDSAHVRVAAPEVDLVYKGGTYCKLNNAIEFNAAAINTDSIRWDFGDGSILVTTPKKITHSYTKAGSFLPKLTLVGAGQCIVPVPAQSPIQVDEIEPGFKLLAINECAKTNYQFTDTSRSFFPVSRRIWKLDQNSTPSNALGTRTELNPKEVNQVYTTAGNYAAGLELQNTIGCKATLDANFNVQVYEFPQATIDAISQACLYNMMEVKSIINSQDSVIRRLWNLGNGFAATDSVVKVLYSSEGNYTVKLTVGTINSCYDSVYKQLSVRPLPTLSMAPDKIVCKGDSVTLKADGALGYIWKDQNDNILCTNCLEVKVAPQKSMQYKVVGFNEYGCSNIISTNVRLIQPFRLDLLASDSMCEGSTRRIVVNGADSYKWYPTPGLSSYTTAVTYATPAVTTTYKVIGKDAYNCFADTGTIQLVIGKPTRVNIGNDTTVISGTPIKLNTGPLSPDIRKWQWAGKADYSCVFCATPEVKVIDDETLTCTVTNQFGCVTTDTMLVKTFCSGSQLFIPNAFTPDGDGVNDVLLVQGRGIKLIKNFRIYTRWGELVFEKNNFQTGDKAASWDGKIRGKLASTDVFVYVCEAICEKGAAYSFKGNVAIIK